MKHLLFFLFLLLCSFSLSARHILGGTISYKRLGASANTIFYELSFELYRDCGVGNPDFDIPLQEVCIFKNDSLFQSLSIEMVGSPVMVATSPYSMCIEKAFYRTTISLPAQDILTINIADSQELTYTIFSLDGKKMQTGTDKILDISTLDTGLYLLFLEIEGKIGRQFFIKQ